MGTWSGQANFFYRFSGIAYAAFVSRNVTMKAVLRFVFLAGMLPGLPAAGILAAGSDLPRYLEFPPRTLYAEHAAFSWVAIIAQSLFILAVTTPFVLQATR
jgi:hypothetical protein